MGYDSCRSPFVVLAEYLLQSTLYALPTTHRSKAWQESLSAISTSTR